MTDFYEEGIKIGSIEYGKVLVANEQLRKIDKTLLNRCKMNGIELIAKIDRENNKVQYTGIPSAMRDLESGGVQWHIGGGILRFWNKVKLIIEDMGPMSKTA